MGYSTVTMDEFGHTDKVVTHKPSGVEFYIYPTLEVVEGTWPTEKRKRDGREYELAELKQMAEEYLKMVGVMA